MAQLTFVFDYDEAEGTWTCTSPSAPEAFGVHPEAYEALMDCAFSAFEMIEHPDEAPKEHRRKYHELNIELFPYVPPTEEEIKPTRTLSQEQQERAARFFNE